MSESDDPIIPPTVEVRAPRTSREEGQREVVAGLRGDPPTLPPRYFYDEVGSRLFEEITRLPEYYPTRAEREILEERSVELAERTRAEELVEIGSGSAEKTRLLLDTLRREGTLRTYVPIDVSERFLRTSAETLARDYPGLRVRGIVADFNSDLHPLPPSSGSRLAIFLGGTLGNLHPDREAPGFISRLSRGLDPGDWFLLGVDRIKEREILERAYDDGAGVTAAFNRNILRVVERRYGIPFEPEAFEHMAFWNREKGWIEMRLRARKEMEIPLGDDGEPLHLRPGDTIRTEISTKYDAARVEALLASSPFRIEDRYTDSGERFDLYLIRRR
ncbi:MAG: L-histidine N(alpha)-methyltransferase [Thermoanaerobaculia bacterium]|nr:L-histidine N(alpha)-methyltransferase [Thermoanaerobaculia bacterium]